jgi:glycerate 2-kinase
LLATGRAQLVPGFPLFRAWCEIDRRIAAADLVLTGEGCFDATSLLGKGPGALLAAARTAGKRAIILAGKVGAAPTGGWPADIRPRAITPGGLPLAQALREAPDRLAAAVRTALTGIN